MVAGAQQGTLLVATLPLVFSVGAGGRAAMPLVERQQHELWLTTAQSLFAVMLIAHFAMNRWEAIALLLLADPRRRRAIAGWPDEVMAGLVGRRAAAERPRRDRTPAMWERS